MHESMINGKPPFTGPGPETGPSRESLLDHLAWDAACKPFQQKLSIRECTSVSIPRSVASAEDEAAAEGYSRASSGEAEGEGTEWETSNRNGQGRSSWQECKGGQNLECNIRRRRSGSRGQRFPGYQRIQL